ncbi:rod shape-determining protein RodA [bacterium]|nr:rod shape-determining protein RodA [bacterium]MCK4436751.1 rod shape-determining protein RodA [bacterium]
MIDRRLLKNFDWPIFLITLIIALIGVAMIYSASQYKSQFLSSQRESKLSYPIKQLIWVGAGLVALLTIIGVNHQTLIKYAYSLYFFNLILLILVLIFGRVAGGAQRWFRLGLFSFQPSELAKIIIILSLARYLKDREAQVKRAKGLIAPFCLVLFPLILILRQPHLGTAFLLLPILFLMLYVAGAKGRHLTAIILIGLLVIAPLGYHFLLKDYQKERLSVFLNPGLDPLGKGYSLNQSKIAIGSGRFWGKGWLKGTQTQLHFLTAQYTDFIFSVLGEEWGFLGAFVVLSLYATLLWRGMRVAVQAKDRAGALLAVGLCAMIALEILINVGMTIGIMPVSGLPLPLLTYGGSSLLTTMLSIGLLLNIQMRRFMF